MSEAIAAYKQGLVMLMDRLEWEQDPAAKAGITSKVAQDVPGLASITSLLLCLCACIMSHVCACCKHAALSLCVEPIS